MRVVTLRLVIFEPLHTYQRGPALVVAEGPIARVTVACCSRCRGLANDPVHRPRRRRRMAVVALPFPEVTHA